MQRKLSPSFFGKAVQVDGTEPSSPTAGSVTPYRRLLFMFLYGEILLYTVYHYYNIHPRRLQPICGIFGRKYIFFEKALDKPEKKWYTVSENKAERSALTPAPVVTVG